MSLRLFYLGIPKTGTNTLTHALRDAGLKVAHGYGPDRRHVGLLLTQAHAEGRDPMHYLPGIEAITHPTTCSPRKGMNYWPQMDLTLLASLRKRHPECVFALARRPVDRLVRSIQKWRNMPERYLQSDIPGLPAGKGGTPEELAAWIRWHRDRLADFFAGDPRFIEINVEDAAASQRALSDVLGIPVPTWPHANRNQC